MGRFSISRVLPWASLAAALSVLSACERDPAPPLLDVTEVQPHEVERGDRLEIRGRGFGEGHAAKLTFRGELHRAGQDATSATIEATGNATSREAIEMVLTERVEALFCRDGDALAHTTFTGDLDVAFAAAAGSVGNATAPPVMATLHDVHLDVLPPVRERAKDDAAAIEGARFLASTGLTVDAHPASAGGLMVTDVARDSVAEHAGLVAGDRLTALDHLSLDSLADARPSGGSGAALFAVRSVDADLERTVSLDCGLGHLGFAAPSGFAAAAAIVGLALAMLLLYIAPRSPYLAWLEHRIAQRLRPNARVTRRDDDEDAPSAWRRLSPLVVLAPFVLLPFADSFGLDLDVGLLFVLLVTAIALASIFGLGDRSYKTTKERIRSLSARLFDQVPAAFALGCVVLLTGSLRLREIVRAQGAMPWDWAVCRTPLAFVLLVAWLSSALRAETGRKGPRSGAPEADLERRARDRSHARMSIGAREIHLAFLAAVGAALFLGGWQADDAHVALRLVGALLFLAKSALLYAAVDVAQSMIPRLDFRQRLRVVVRTMLPLALVGFVATLAWAHLGPTHALEHAAGLATFGLAAVVVLRSSARIVQATLGFAPTTPAHLDPFL